MEQSEEIYKKVDYKIWKDFFKYLKPYKKQFLRLIFLMICLGAMDSTFPMLSKYAIDNFIENKSLNGIEGFIAVYFLAVLVLSLIIYWFIKLAGKLETQMAYDIRKLGFTKLQELPLSYYDDKAVGWLMSRMTSDITRLSETISWGLVDFAWGISMMTGVTIYMMILNWKLALVTLPVIPL